MCTMSQHPHAMAWAHLFPRVLFPVPTHGSRGMPVATPALCQCCHMQPGHTYSYTCHIQLCHFVMGTSTHTVVCLVPSSRGPWVYLFTCLPCSSTATWWHQHACSYPHSVQNWHLVLFACLLCPRATTWSTGMLVCKPDGPEQTLVHMLVMSCHRQEVAVAHLFANVLCSSAATS